MPRIVYHSGEGADGNHCSRIVFFDARDAEIALPLLSKLGYSAKFGSSHEIWFESKPTITTLSAELYHIFAMPGPNRE